jgi:hypothetical protein
MTSPAAKYLFNSSACLTVSRGCLWLVMAIACSPRGFAAEKAAPPVSALAPAPDGKSVLAGSQAGLGKFSFPELKPQGPIKTSLEQIHALAFAPGGDLLAAAGGVPPPSRDVEGFTRPPGNQK